MKRAHVAFVSMAAVYILGMRSGARQQFDKFGPWPYYSQSNLYDYYRITDNRDRNWQNCYSFANVVNAELAKQLNGGGKISDAYMGFDLLYSSVRGPVLTEIGREVCAITVVPANVKYPRNTNEDFVFAIDSEELYLLIFDIKWNEKNPKNHEQAVWNALRQMGHKAALQAYSYLLQSDGGRRAFRPGQVFK